MNNLSVYSFVHGVNRDRHRCGTSIESVLGKWTKKWSVCVNKHSEVEICWWDFFCNLNKWFWV